MRIFSILISPLRYQTTAMVLPIGLVWIVVAGWTVLSVVAVSMGFSNWHTEGRILWNVLIFASVLTLLAKWRVKTSPQVATEKPRPLDKN